MTEQADGTGGGALDREQLAVHLKRLEDYLVTLKVERAGAESALAAQTEFVTAVCHELRTSLSAVFAFADLLLVTDLDETQRDYTAQLRAGADEMLAVLGDVLDHAKLSAGRLELNPKPFSLNHLISTVGKALEARCRVKGLEATVSYSGNLPEALEGDATRVRQVLLNFIDNAVKFTETGKVALLVERLSSGNGGVLLRFSVRDSGVGVSDAVRDRLFQEFQQGDGGVQGTGLGLAIASKIVELLGGDIGFDSVQGKGSVFWFTASFGHVQGEGDLAEDDELFAEELKAAPQPEPEPESVKRAHILVVEDNRVNQLLVTTYLNKFGHTFTVVDNGYDAVEAVKRNNYDLVLMDVHMPEMDGLQTAKAIRNLDGKVRSVPIVAVTANALHERRKTYVEAGMNACLTKPIDAMQLLNMVNAQLSAPRKPLVGDDDAAIGDTLDETRVDAEAPDDAAGSEDADKNDNGDNGDKGDKGGKGDDDDPDIFEDTVELV